MIRPGSCVKLHLQIEHEGALIWEGPLTYIQGQEPRLQAVDQVLPQAIETALAGCDVGDVVDQVLEAPFGRRRRDACIRIPRDEAPEELKVGDLLQPGDEEAAPAFRVVEIGETEVLLDTNHPLAGKTKTVRFVAKVDEIG